MRAASENALSEDDVTYRQDPLGQIAAKIVNARAVARGRRGQQLTSEGDRVPRAVPRVT